MGCFMEKYRYPDFLVLGVQKAGTTWLYDQFLNHPEIFVPPLRKEIHFFDQFYYKGPEWYLSFFSKMETSSCKMCGEITPKYFYDKTVPKKIFDLFSDVKFIVILRDPINRFYSQYRMEYSQGNTDLSPLLFGFNNPESLERGLYSAQLENYLKYFSLNNFLFLVYEEIFSDINSTISALSTVAHFLNVNPDLFAEDLIFKKKGSEVSSGRPKYIKLYKFARYLRKYIMKYDMDYIVNFLKKYGLHNKFFCECNRGMPKLSSDDHRFLIDYYFDDYCKLRDILGREINNWF